MSIGVKARHSGNATDAPASHMAGSERRALPRFLRKPARVFSRLISGNLTISKRGWIILVVGAGLIAGSAVFANSRHGNVIIADVTTNMGFGIKSVALEGAREISRHDILSRLALNFDDGKPKSLFSFDIVKAREELAKMPWVKSVVVSKSYPDRLVVRVVEHKPYAIWQRGKKLELIVRNGKVIERFDGRFADLPLLVGKGANIHGADIIFQAGQIAALKGQIKAYVRVGDRRWDLRLKNGITVRLSADDPAMALRKLAQLDKNRDLLSRDLKIIDMRLRDRMVVTMSEEGAGRRAAQAKAGISGKIGGKI